MSTSNSEEENYLCSTPPDVRCEASDVECLLPENSKDKYLLAYQNFIQWRNSKNTQSLTENVFLAYFDALRAKYKPSSLWCIYSMLRSTVRTQHGVDLKTYTNLLAYLKRLSGGFKSKKSKVLSAEDIQKFIKEAPDNQYLATKVALIFGVTGGCRTQELTNVTIKDIETHGQMLLVKVASMTKRKTPRSFTIHGPFFEIVKKYESLRSPKANNDRFFLNYQNGKCTCQPIGINKFGAMPKEIAKFLGLADAENYTGHSFRRTSVKLLANAGADIMTLKSNGERQSRNVAESYVEDPIQEDPIQEEEEGNKKEMCTKRLRLDPENFKITINSEECPPNETPNTSNDWFSPTYIKNEQNEITIEHESISVHNLSDETDVPAKIVNYNFTNCTFTNCFTNSKMSSAQ